MCQTCIVLYSCILHLLLIQKQCVILHDSGANTHSDGLFTFHTFRRIYFSCYYYLFYNGKDNNNTGKKKHPYKQPSVEACVVCVGFQPAADKDIS